MQDQARFTVVTLAILAFCLALGARAVRAAPLSSSTQTTAKTKPIPPPEARIDINHASAEELLKVPGMTPTWAARIVRFRPYRSKQDLLDRGVLPSEVYDRIKDNVIAHRDKE